MPNEGPFPPRWRVLAGFILAPAVPGLVFSALYPAFAGLTDPFERIWRTFIGTVIFGGYVPAFAFGVPAYMILRLWLKPTLVACATAGAGVAAFPWTLLVLAAWTDERRMIGQLTWFRLSEAASMVGEVALFGAMGGAVFWLVAVGVSAPCQWRFAGSR
jgi:hypothetical protein